MSGPPCPGSAGPARPAGNSGEMLNSNVKSGQDLRGGAANAKGLCLRLMAHYGFIRGCESSGPKSCLLLRSPRCLAAEGKLAAESGPASPVDLRHHASLEPMMFD